MNKQEKCRQKRLARHKLRRKEKKPVRVSRPNVGMTPRCKAILARNRERLRGEGKDKILAPAHGFKKVDKSLRRTMAS